MPGGRRWDPIKEPFSYAKLCFYYFPGLLVFLGIAVLLISAFGEVQWLDRISTWLPASVLLRVAIGAALLVAYYVGGWPRLWN
jgi:hypothetical protein